MTKKDNDKYPPLKKGKHVKCLACNNGWVYDRTHGKRLCKACGGKGFIPVN